MQQYLPLAVLKRFKKTTDIIMIFIVATVLTACGIETELSFDSCLPIRIGKLQQYLPLAVCDEGCETAEEQSDDEVRTSLVPD